MANLNKTCRITADTAGEMTKGIGMQIFRSQAAYTVLISDLSDLTNF